MIWKQKSQCNTGISLVQKHNFNFFCSSSAETHSTDQHSHSTDQHSQNTDQHSQNTDQHSQNTDQTAGKYIRCTFTLYLHLLTFREFEIKKTDSALWSVYWL